jgi:hypothetical protein
LILSFSFRQANACSDAGTAAASADSVCYNVTVTLSTTGFIGSQFQWQSFNGTQWVDETGQGSNTASYDVELIATTRFRIIVTEPSCPSDTSNEVEVVVGTIPVPSATGITRCGPGFVNLAGTGAGTLQWFADPSATVPFATGNTVNTFVGTSTTLYVADQVQGGIGANSPVLITEMEVQTNDILEIQNVGPVPVDVTGWKVAVNNSYTDINNVNPIVQILNGVLNPGDILQFSDVTTGPGTYWGNNILWNSGAFPTFSGWALILDDQDNVMDFVPMNWPVANIQSMAPVINGVTVSPGSVWTGDGVNITNTVAGLSIQRNGSVDNNSSSDFTDQSISNGQTNPLMTIPFTGFGCSSPLIPVQVTITPSDAVSISASSTSFCQSGSATLTASSNNANYSYTWSPSTGLNTTSGATVISTPPSFGDITYIVIGDDGNCSNVDSVTISVGQPTTAGIATSYQDTICLGKDTDLILVGSFGNIQWQSLSGGNWVNETGPGSNTAAYTVAPVANTTYRAYLTSGSCPPDSSNLVDIAVLPVSDPVTTNDSLCGGGTANLLASGQGTLNWYSSPGAAIPVTTGTSYSFSTTSTVTYYVESLIGSEYSIGANNSGFGSQNSTAGNNTGMQFDVLRPVTIDFVHVYPNATGTITINLRQTLGGPVLATYTQNVTAFTGKTAIPVGFSVPVGTGYRLEMATGSVACTQNTIGAVYPYTVPNGPVNITGYVNPNPASGGIYLYFYDWIVTEGCRSARIPVSAVVSPFPAIPSITQNWNFLTSSSATGNQWYLNGNPIPGATAQTYEATQTGNYTVVVTLNGCSTTSPVFQVTFIGLEENEASLINVYPNPVSNILTIDAGVSSGDYNEYSILDITGRIMIEHTAPLYGKLTTVDVSNLGQGVYFLELRSANQSVRKRFTVER